MFRVKELEGIRDVHKLQGLSRKQLSHVYTEGLR